MKPIDEKSVVEIVQSTAGPLQIVGGGTRSKDLVTADKTLSVAGLSGVSLYEPGALTLVAQAGTPIAEINRVLAAERQRLAFEPMDHRGLLSTSGEPTIGGAVAANVSGPRRIQAGACRDSLLGVRFVDGAGRILKNGGRVMKNVTGYDLVKLMAGSRGTLGVVTEVSLKVQAIPECTGTLAWSGLGWAAALKVFSGALGSPYDITGAARLPEGWGNRDESSWTFIRVEGLENSVKYRLGELQKTFAEFPAPKVILDHEENQQIWQSVRNVSPFGDKVGNVWRTSVKPTDMISVVGKSDYEHVVDWGGGLVWTLAPEDVDLRQILKGIEGYSTLVRGDAFPSFEPENAIVTRLSEGLRQKFDPRGIFNPGLMG
ncbi:FAD-binding protein [Cochlodiniinecator piscidefendens]|uniref:FAD-binding protein n=1 Tax=Cochlodiniinecator piscidefendens TaxID=2715756 RepID=UPI00140D059A|nr:FAD-binding protein [Cochlodiniinecator piscidefendens]